MKRFPETTFVLQHAGMPHDLSNSGWAEWNTFMESLAEYENLSLNFQDWEHLLIKMTLSLYQILFRKF